MEALAKRDEIPFMKDTAYRFLNSHFINWYTYMICFASSIIDTFMRPLTTDKNQKVLILDDTSYSRDRSKKVELLSRFYDHSKSKFYKGFKLLTLAWSDGHITIP